MKETKIVGWYLLVRTNGSLLWDVTRVGHIGVICHVQIMTTKGEVTDEYDFANPSKAYKVTAEDVPGVGNLSQIVKGNDLIAYFDSIMMARGML